VIGAGGFVGRHVMRGFECERFIVTPFFGPDDAVDEPRTPFFRGDVRDEALLERALDGAELVIHAAGPPSVADSFSDPNRYVDIHVRGTALVAAAARAAGVRRLLYVSSAEVYGQGGARVTEETPPQPVSPYGAAKLAAEWMVRTIHATDGHRPIVLRPFSLYGSGMRADGVVGRIVQAIREGAPLHLQTLAPVRDFLHIDDLIDLMLTLVEHPDPPAIVNGCSGTGISIGELAETALRLAGRRDLPHSNGALSRPNDITMLVGEPSLAEGLGWRPSRSLTEGLAEMIGP